MSMKSARPGGASAPFLRWPLVAALMLAGLASHAQTVNITETFRNATALDWSLHGNASLTAATGAEGDAAGTGWLRLTGSTDDQAGSAIYEQAFSSANGIDVQFEYATWRPDAGEGADGFTFYLIDGATVAPTVGARGGSLGYSWGEHGAGVTNGFVGVGFDELGNFSNHRYGACDASVAACAPGTTLWNNRVAVRGSGSLNGTGDGGDPQNQTTGFLLLRSVTPPVSGAGNTHIVSGSRDNAKNVRILVTPGPDVKMTVILNGNTLIDAMPLAHAGAPVAGMAALPATFKLGFSGSTGALHNTHEIRNLTVRQATLAAVNDSYTATAGVTLNVPAADGLGKNDTGVLPGAQFSLQTPSPNGTATVQADGSFRFEPAAGFTGSTTFEYQVCNQPATNPANCRTATVTIHVTGPSPGAGVQAVPTLGGWALAGLAALLGGLGGLGGMRRRPRA